MSPDFEVPVKVSHFLPADEQTNGRKMLNPVLISSCLHITYSLTLAFAADFKSCGENHQADAVGLPKSFDIIV